MALKFSAQLLLDPDAIEEVFPFTLSELGRELLKDARPDWETVRIRVGSTSALGRPLYLARIECQGGTRDCKVRGD